MSWPGLYHCKTMDTRLVRESYPLAALQSPGLSMTGWRERIRAALSDDETLTLVAVYNAMHCVIAVVRHSAAGADFFLKPPALLADTARILEAVHHHIVERTQPRQRLAPSA